MRHEPDLLFVEALINDGDAILEDGDTASVRLALEGIVRQVKAALPAIEICFIYMHLRDDLPPSRRSGTVSTPAQKILYYDTKGDLRSRYLSFGSFQYIGSMERWT